jgi:phage terminase large subunit GpA-like protein
MISGIEDLIVSGALKPITDRPPYMTGIEMRRVASNSIRRLCEPQEEISVTDFSARHRILPETSTSPGPYDPSVVPFARRPLDLMGSVDIPMVVLCWASQLTKSTLIENAMMYRMKRMPSPIVIVQPKIEAAEAWAKERFRPMVRATPLLKKLVKTGRTSGATLRYYPFPGGFAFVASAKSATELAARSSPFLFLDEVDRMVHIVGEGNPVEIVMRRQGAADIGLAVLTSTPRDAQTTIIWPYLEAGTYEFFHVPCPHCGQMQPLLWENLRWDRGKPSDAHYLCVVKRADATSKIINIGCGAVIEEKYKHEMLAKGRWIASNPEGDYPSFHLNALYSPFAKSGWGMLASEWDRAQGKPEDLQVFVNTRLCELWEETKEATDPNALFARVEPDLAERVVPRGAAVLTAGVDVQANRLEVYVWAWGDGLESWLVAHYILPGDPEREPDQPGSIWRQLDDILLQQFPHADSGGVECVPITMTFVDSGFASTKVYRYTNARKGRNIFASKGIGGDGVQLLGKATLQGNEKTILYPVGTDKAKSEFIRSQVLEQQHGPGYVHLGGWVTEDQCKQLLAERRKRKLVRGRVVYTWVKKKEADENEALDCRVYARAALEHPKLGARIIKALGELGVALTARARELAKAPPRPAGSVQQQPRTRMLSRGLPRDN